MTETKRDYGVGRDKLLGLRLTPPEHALIHAAAQVEGTGNTSAWARDLLLTAARDAFRSALRPAAARLREEEAAAAAGRAAAGEPAPVPEEVEA